MWLKVIICIFVYNSLGYNFLLARSEDSIKYVAISDHLILDNESNEYTLGGNNYAFFDTDANKLYLSFELNRTDSSKLSSFVFLEIKKKSLQQFRLRPIISKKILLSERAVYIDSLDLADSLFASGNFDLIVSYMYDSMKVLDVKKIAFQLLKNSNTILKDDFFSVDSDRISNNINIESTFVSKYTIDQIKKNNLALLPLAQGIESKVIKELSTSDDLLVQKRFFFNFWYNRNPSDPEKAWNEYTEKLNYVAKKYGSASTPGYATDRGRIYIQYGVPDRLIRVVNEKGALPYEVWFYYRSGLKHNVKFLFFQPGMLSNEMILLQSNQEEEIINPYWKEMLLKDPNNGDNKLIHKVFEFFK